MSDRSFIRRLHEKYGATTLAAQATRIAPADSERARYVSQHARGRDSAAALLEHFFDDAQIPVAVLHSRALDRDFVLARDVASLEALSEAQRSLPVLFYTDADHIAGLDLENLRVLLDLREQLGPDVALREVRPAGTLQ